MQELLPSLSDPVVQTLLPLAAAFLAALFLRILAGPRRVPLAIAVGFLVGYIAIVGLPPFPPRSAGQKIVYIAAGAALLGLVVDGLTSSPAARRIAAAVAWTAAAAWIAQVRLVAGLAPGLLLPVAVWAAGLAALWSVDRGQGAGIRAPAALLAAAIGIGGLAIVAASASVGQLGLALAAAIGGYLLWNWPVTRDGFGATGLLAGGVVALSLILQLALFTRAPWPALAVLGLCFAAAGLPAGGGSGGLRRAAGAVLHLGLALVPAFAAWGLAHLLLNSR